MGKMLLILSSGCLCTHCFLNLNALSCGRKVSLGNDCIFHVCYPTGVKAREAVMILWSDNVTSGVTHGWRNSCRSSCTPLWSQFVVDGGLETMAWCNLLKMDRHMLGQILQRFVFSESLQHARHWALPSSCGSLLGTNTFCRLFQCKTNKSLMLGLLLSLKYLTKQSWSSERAQIVNKVSLMRGKAAFYLRHKFTSWGII